MALCMDATKTAAVNLSPPQLYVFCLPITPKSLWSEGENTISTNKIASSEAIRDKAKEEKVIFTVLCTPNGVAKFCFQDHNHIITHYSFLFFDLCLFIGDPFYIVSCHWHNYNMYGSGFFASHKLEKKQLTNRNFMPLLCVFFFWEW